jgi:hypothetical protein
MSVLRWLADTLLGLFLSVLWLGGVWMQLYGEFYTGMFVVVLALGVEFVRQMRRMRRTRMGWGSFVWWGFGALLSIGMLVVTAILAVFWGGRMLYILLLNTALSSVVFLLGSFLWFWGYRRGLRRSVSRGSRRKNKKY